jgi:hypothetical protein
MLIEFNVLRETNNYIYSAISMTRTIILAINNTGNNVCCDGPALLMDVLIATR